MHRKRCSRTSCDRPAREECMNDTCRQVSRALRCRVVAGQAIVLLGIVSMVPAQTFTVLHTFKGKPGAAVPLGALIRDESGNLYGTSANGGSDDLGTVYKLDPNGNETVLYSFKGAPDGSEPTAGLSRDADGNFYGTTAQGGNTGGNCGSNGCGVVFKLDINGNETVVYRFSGGIDGASPSAITGVVFATTPNCCDDRNLYGTTVKGGDLSCVNALPAGSGCGVLFKLDLDGNETVLHAFHGDSGGFRPGGVLVVDNELQIWGTTAGGGGQGCYDPSRNINVGCGLAYVVVPTGGAGALHRFNGTDGNQPNSLIFANVYDIYGTTSSGGTGGCGGAGCGTVFKIQLNGPLTSLHSFNFTDGAGPRGGLALDAAGNLYGTTGSGGNSNGDGVLFKIDASGNETVLHTFDGATDGRGSGSGVLQDGSGNLYGTAARGGEFDAGTVFKFTIPADFLLSATPLSPDTVNPGGSSISSVSVTAVGSFNTTVNLTCSVQPAPQLAPKCSISPDSVSPGTPATLTVTTTAPTRAFYSSAGPRFFYAMWLPLMAWAGVRARDQQRKRRVTSMVLLGCLLFISVFFQVACGGGSSSNNNGGGARSPGTPAGTYSITVNGVDASGNLQHSTTATLTVQ